MTRAEDALPEDWQARMVEMIRGAAPLDGAWFTGSPALAPVDQIRVYHGQYQLRLLDALLVEAPGVAALLGLAPVDDATGHRHAGPSRFPEIDGEALCRAYLAEHPSRSWTLDRVAIGFAGWLEARGVRREVVDMALLDRAVQAGFSAAAGRPLQPEDLARMPRLELQPPVSLLRLRTNAHWVRSAVLAGQEPPPSEQGDFPIVVFRRGVGMRHWVVPLGSWGILEGIRDGLDVGAAIERTFERNWVGVEELTSELSTWFKDYAERNLVQLA